MIKPIDKPLDGERFHFDAASVYCTSSHISKLTGAVFTEEDGDGLGMIDLAFLSFNGITVRVMYYKEGPIDKDAGCSFCSFSFPIKTPYQRDLIEKFLKELNLKAFWISPNI